MISNTILEDTIVGISTTVGRGAISIIRLSGEKAIEIVNKAFNILIFIYIKFDCQILNA